ncbi:hypothetical protein SBADM41S_07452 [Streptomyces badius]
MCAGHDGGHGQVLEGVDQPRPRSSATAARSSSITDDEQAFKVLELFGNPTEGEVRLPSPPVGGAVGSPPASCSASGPSRRRPPSTRCSSSPSSSATRCATPGRGSSDGAAGLFALLIALFGPGLVARSTGELRIPGAGLTTVLRTVLFAALALHLGELVARSSSGRSRGRPVPPYGGRAVLASLASRRGRADRPAYSRRQRPRHHQEPARARKGELLLLIANGMVVAAAAPAGRPGPRTRPARRRHQHGQAARPAGGVQPGSAAPHHRRPSDGRVAVDRRPAVRPAHHVALARLTRRGPRPARPVRAPGDLAVRRPRRHRHRLDPAPTAAGRGVHLRLRPRAAAQAGADGRRQRAGPGGAAADAPGHRPGQSPTASPAASRSCWAWSWWSRRSSPSSPTRTGSR